MQYCETAIMADYNVMYGEKNKKLVIVQGFKFGFQKMLANDVERWICTQRSCKCYLKIDSREVIIERKVDHNHNAIDTSVLNRQKLSNSVKRAACDNIHELPSKIVRRELASGDVDTLTMTDIRRIKSNLHHARSQLHPPLPKTLADLHDALDRYDLVTNRGENFLFINDRISNIVGFSCETNLNVLRQAKTMYVDGTFESSPKLFQQIFIIHTVIDNIYVPLAFFLLPDKTISSYKNALLHIKNYVQPDIVYVDFEKAIHAALRAVWPTVQLKGCRFHLGQSWWRKILTVGLSKDYRDKESEDGKLLKYIFGLPLLAPHEVEPSFFDDFMPLKPVNEKYDEFFDYLLETYILPDSDFPPSMWAELSASCKRTTNACESFHSKLNCLFNKPHPNIYYIADTLKEIQSETYIKLRSTAAQTVANKEEYLRAQINEYRRGTITRFQYLKRVCYKFLPQV